MSGRPVLAVHGHSCPCRLCEKHTPTCHAGCKEYSIFRAACDENRARRSRKRDVDWAVGDAMRRNPGKREV